MARKVSPELLELHQGELGIWRRKKDREPEFETLMNFSFEIAAKVTLGRAMGSGAIYTIHVPGKEPGYVSI